MKKWNRIVFIYYEFGCSKLFHNNFSYTIRHRPTDRPTKKDLRKIEWKKATRGNNIEFVQVDPGPTLITKYEKRQTTT